MVPGTDVSASPFFRIVSREGATAATARLNYSAVIWGKDLLNAQFKAYVAPTEQISFVGYNGSTGSIDNTSTEYFLTIVDDWDDLQSQASRPSLPWDAFSRSVRSPFHFGNAVPYVGGAF